MYLPTKIDRALQETGLEHDLDMDPQNVADHIRCLAKRAEAAERDRDQYRSALIAIDTVIEDTSQHLIRARCWVNIDHEYCVTWALTPPQLCVMRGTPSEGSIVRNIYPTSDKWRQYAPELYRQIIGLVVNAEREVKAQREAWLAERNARSDLAADNERLRAVVENAGKQFRVYESLHRKKSYHENADANAEFAAMCETVLTDTADASPWQPISTAPQNREVLVMDVNGAVFRARFMWVKPWIGYAWTVNANFYTVEGSLVDAEYPSGTVLCGDCEPTHWMPFQTDAQAPTYATS